MTMRLYRTRDGVARRDGDELVLLELPGHDVIPGLADRIDLAREAPERARIPLTDAELLCPTSHPGKVVLAGGNYLDHVAEAGLATVTAAPVFITMAGDAVVGPGTPIVLPADAPAQVDYEGELALIVGTGGSHIAAADAWTHIAAVTIVNDVSARDVQLSGMADGAITDTDNVRRGKGFPTFKPLGPCLVTVDEFESPLSLQITTYVNGEVRQSARTSEMIFSVPEIVEYVSSSVHLATGDLILTGTPGGVGLATGAYLKAGDLVEIDIEGIGRLTNPVVASNAVPMSAPMHRVNS
jgi:2-keto-4-pentenoate hydratase/2-oxohepta-3-ene-1,7-dioic acid hydratase in catechol pathway